MVTEENVRRIEIIIVTVIIGGLGLLALSDDPAEIIKGPGNSPAEIIEMAPDMTTTVIVVIGILVAVGILVFRITMDDSGGRDVVVVNQGEASNCFGEQMQRCGNGLHKMLGYDTYHECLDKESQQQCQK